MRKLRVVMLAVFAFSAVAAAMASAETTLLAEWLLGGIGVEALTSTEALGRILVEDKTFGAAFECEGTVDGSVGPNGEGEITAVLTEAGEEVTLAKPLTLTGCKAISGCSTTNPVEVAPEELPWHTLLYLTEAGKFRDHVFKAAYAVTCTIIIKSTDECKSVESSFEVLPSEAGAEAVGLVEPGSNCSVGGSGAGHEEFKGVNHLVDLLGNPVIPSSE